VSSFTRGDWRLEWEHHGEGYSGDYNDEDPDDKALLRADLYYGDKPCNDGSYCTLAPDDTPEETLKRFSDDLFDKLEDGVKNIPDFVDWETTAEDRFDEVKFNDRVMQEWTWRTEP
jgi:hypothetical protein